MMKYFFLIFFFTYNFCLGQDSLVKTNRYKEDQIYIGTSYILLNQEINGLKQNGFSRSFYLGFINDISLNKKGNLAIAFGFGYAYNNQISNLNFYKDEYGSEKVNINDGIFLETKNKLISNVLEFPIEFRWRTSSFSNYSFWRIYLGYKFGYKFFNKAKSYYEEKIILRNISPFSQSITLSLGYNTWNVYLEYGVTNILESNYDYGLEMPLNLRPIKIGFIFYIL